jgi:3-mercaptopropionate dioxygenase
MVNTQQLTGRMQRFVMQMSELLDQAADNEVAILDNGVHYLRELVSKDDWLPDSCAKPHAEHYQQYLLYRDPAERFSVVSFVWGPGQQTPVHDHTVWGLIGMLRGSEIEQQYQRQEGKLIASGKAHLSPGDVGMVSPKIGDIHQVFNAHDDRVSISIHVYGADIGRVERHVIDPVNGEMKSFVSGYANKQLPDFVTDRTG